MADGMRQVLGDGSDLGIRIRYVEEPKPLGTGGALKFAEELLSEVYIELIGGRQATLVLGEEPEAPTIAVAYHGVVVGERPAPRAFTLSPDEQAAHRAALEHLGAKAIWQDYLTAAEAA